MQSYFTGENLLICVLFILAVCWAFNMFFTSMSNWRKLRNEQEEPILKLTARVENVERILDTDKRRLEQHEQLMAQMQEELKDQQEQDKIMLKAVKALLNHGIHNGNSDEMERAASDIDDYLMGRK